MDNNHLDLEEDVKTVLSLPPEERIAEAQANLYPFYREFRELSEKAGIGEEQAFYVFQDVLVFLIGADQHLRSDSEIVIYSDFCLKAGYEVLKASDFLRLQELLNGDDSRAPTSFLDLIMMREVLFKEQKFKIFTDFIRALWCLVLSDRSLEEREYKMILPFYDEESDKILTWDALREAVKK